jgi:hypothetical protein
LQFRGERHHFFRQTAALLNGLIIRRAGGNSAKVPLRGDMAAAYDHAVHDELLEGRHNGGFPRSCTVF